MTHAVEKYVVTRKPHECHECGIQIPKGTKCYWFKAVTFKNSDVGRNQWEEFHVCPECDRKARLEE